MSSGRPTVCFDTPNNRAIMADSGFFAEQPTAASFVDQLATVIANPAIAAERGARARELIEQQYSWRSSALRIMDRYVELLA
jgi:glycosyltransferase involved in cell wall biosynthesis